MLFGGKLHGYFDCKNLPAEGVPEQPGSCRRHQGVHPAEGRQGYPA